MDDYRDDRTLWKNELPAGVSRFRRWMYPALTAVVILILIIALGASNTKMSNRLSSVEQRVSNLDVIQSLNTSLQISDALKQLAAVDTLSRAVASLKCSLERIISNSSATDDCCPLGWELFSSSCYFFSSSALSWNDSRDWCERQGSHLVILNTDTEWNFVNGRKGARYYWVGLTDERTGKWEWVNQTPYIMERRRWMPHQPDNWNGHGLLGTEDCAHLHQDGRLNDVHCSTEMNYICQKHSLRG